MAKLMNQRCL